MTFEKEVIRQKARSFFKARWILLFWDIVFTALIMWLFLTFPNYFEKADNWYDVLHHIGLYLGFATILRFIWRVYAQIWRYGGVQSYMRLIIADGMAAILYYITQRFSPFIGALNVREMATCIPIATLFLLFCRMFYRYLYKKLDRRTKFGRFVTKFFNIFFHCDWDYNSFTNVNKIKVAFKSEKQTPSKFLAEETCSNPYISSIRSMHRIFLWSSFSQTSFSQIWN